MHQRLVSQDKGASVKDTRNFLAGNVADALAERWLAEDDPRPGQMLEWLPEVFASWTEGGDAQEGKLRWRGPDDRQRIYDNVAGGLPVLEALLIEHVLAHDYETQTRLDAAGEHPDGYRYEFTGRPDYLVRLEPGTYRVLDLKMTTRPDYWRQTLAQLLFYEIALLLMLPEGSAFAGGGFIQPLVVPHYIPVEWTEDHRRSMMSRVLKFVAHEAAQAPPVPNPEDCWGCDTKHACPVHRPVADGKRVSLGDTAAARAVLHGDG